MLTVGRALTSLLLLGALTTSCDGDERAGVHELRGYAVVGGELWAFQECGSAELMAISIQGTEPGYGKLETALGTFSSPSEIRTAYLEMRARVSGPGDYAPQHLRRQLDILEVHDAQPTGPTTCAKLEPRVP